MKILVTKRLILRPLKQTDLIAFHAYAKKDAIGPNAGWAPHTSLKESEKFLKLLIKEQEVWAITFKESDELIGTIGLHVRNFENAMENRRELGYVLDDVYWGKGLMTEASEKVLAHGFLELDLDEIVCGHLPSNKRSQRVIEKTNFIYSHDELRDYLDDQKAMINMYVLSKKKYKELKKNDKLKTKI